MFSLPFEELAEVIVAVELRPLPIFCAAADEARWGKSAAGSDFKPRRPAELATVQDIYPMPREVLRRQVASLKSQLDIEIQQRGLVYAHSLFLAPKSALHHIAVAKLVHWIAEQTHKFVGRMCRHWEGL